MRSLIHVDWWKEGRENLLLTHSFSYLAIRDRLAVTTDSQGTTTLRLKCKYDDGYKHPDFPDLGWITWFGVPEKCSRNDITESYEANRYGTVVVGVKLIRRREGRFSIERSAGRAGVPSRTLVSVSSDP